MRYRYWSNLRFFIKKYVLRSWLRRYFIQLRCFRFCFRWKFLLFIILRSWFYLRILVCTFLKKNTFLKSLIGILGNMSNPTINRLGVNQFWYKHWYSDTFYKSQIQQDLICEKLLKFSINAGSTFQSNPFIHEYWYKPSFRKQRTLVKSNNTKFFRRYYYSHSMLGIEHSYLIRNKNIETFPMRMWVFRFSGWLIFSFQMFKPLKGKNVSLKNNSLDPAHSSSILVSNKNKTKTNRVKLLLCLLKVQQNHNTTNFYLF